MNSQNLFKIVICFIIAIAAVPTVNGGLLSFLTGASTNNMGKDQTLGRNMFGDMSEIFGDDLDGQILEYVYRYLTEDDMMFLDTFMGR